MSMNIEISATREIWFKNRDGETKTEWQTSYFNAIQTNSSTTFDILESQDRKLAYIDAVMRVFVEGKQVPVYADDDHFCDGPVIGYETYNFGKEHVSAFLEWVEHVESAGYTVYFDMI